MSGWIEWNGGSDRPDIGSAEVELKFRDGLTSDGHIYPADIIGWMHIGCRDDIVAYRVAEADELFPQPRRRDGKEPCGECHLPVGETCDICGASA